ncbi:site-specific integrase [Streptomyces sp. NPDC005180]|uniref:tyrosine-type recombinase/integrase n=1 Tax=Streptomyces sp. NPDC005180 TaxID=3156868 RepID=UPI0033A480D8
MGKRWQVRYRNLDGEQRKENFDNKTGAGGADERRLEVEQLLARRIFVDAKAGEVLFERWALEVWLPSLDCDAASRAVYERHLRVHIVPALRPLAIGRIKPSDVKRLRASIDGAQSHRDSIMSTVATVMQAAVADKLRDDNPCHADGVTRPRLAETRPIDVWPEERVLAVLGGLPDHLWAWGATGAGCGHRPAELVAVSPEDFDAAVGEAQVVRQIKWLSGGIGWCFAPPKGGKTRTTVLADSVVQALGAHMERWPPVMIELPWYDKRDKPSKRFRPEKVPMIFTNPANGEFVNLKRVNELPWKRALAAAGVIPTPEKEAKGAYAAAPDDGVSALRHFFASSQLAAGESVIDVAGWMGHEDPLVTIRRYIRGSGSAGVRGRAATDRLLGGTVTRVSPAPVGTFTCVQCRKECDPDVPC